jgi:hypothetical protein
MPTQYYSQPDDLGAYGDSGGNSDPGGCGDESRDYIDEEGSKTNPCAFPGDPLCLDTPITVPRRTYPHPSDGFRRNRICATAQGGFT